MGKWELVGQFYPPPRQTSWYRGASYGPSEDVSYIAEQSLCLLQHCGQLSHALFVPPCLFACLISASLGLILPKSVSIQAFASDFVFQRIQTETKLILHTLFFKNCPVASVLLNAQPLSTSFFLGGTRRDLRMQW